jgi:orotidine-5'-phosphate decarboxylase
MNYSNKLKKIIGKNKSNLIVGLDSDIRKIPRIFLRTKNPEFEFNKCIINVTKDIAAGYKLNLAFYEVLGRHCYETIEKTLQVIPKNMIKICDGKRGDIGNTDEYYARAYFDDLDFDSVTINPFMGRDSIEPFLERKEKGIYVLAYTSNKGSEDFQKQKIGKKFLYEIIIEKCVNWDKNKQVGFVIGANHTDIIKKITTRYPYISILIPGIGAQGNNLNELLKNIKNNNFLINASRSIIYDEEDFKKFSDYEKKVRMKAETLRSALVDRK